jgi:hypothetical protein
MRNEIEDVADAEVKRWAKEQENMIKENELDDLIQSKKDEYLVNEGRKNLSGEDIWCKWGFHSWWDYRADNLYYYIRVCGKCGRWKREPFSDGF